MSSTYSAANLPKLGDVPGQTVLPSPLRITICHHKLAFCITGDYFERRALGQGDLGNAAVGDPATPSQACSDRQPFGQLAPGRSTEQQARRDELCQLPDSILLHGTAGVSAYATFLCCEVCGCEACHKQVYASTLCSAHR